MRGCRERNGRRWAALLAPSVFALSVVLPSVTHADPPAAQGKKKTKKKRGKKGKPETAHYLCEACEGRNEEHHKTAMLAAGEWRSTAVPQDPGTIGFHISALYSPVGWLSWADIARLWEAASTDEAKRSFKNGVLGETWVETGEAPDWQRLYERRETWPLGTVPDGGLFLTAGADVQKDRIEVSVWAWGRGLESWLVDHLVIDGGAERAEAWARLSALLNRTWPHEPGAWLGLAKLGIDTGYEAPAVYAWARAHGFAQVAAVKGVAQTIANTTVTAVLDYTAPIAGYYSLTGAVPWENDPTGRREDPRGPRPPR